MNVTLVGSKLAAKARETSAAVIPGKRRLRSSRRCDADITGSRRAKAPLIWRRIVRAGSVPSRSTASSALAINDLRTSCTSRSLKP